MVTVYTMMERCRQRVWQSVSPSGGNDAPPIRDLMARNFRLWHKKRGDRTTGSELVGGLGEALFFGILFLLGAVSLTYLITTNLMNPNPEIYAFGWGFWLRALVVTSFVVIGGGGVVYTVLQVGTSAERRSALAKRAANIDLTGGPPSPEHAFPGIPRDANLTNSPGVRLAYRLPVTHAGAWVLIAASAFCLVWNGIAAALITIAVKSHVHGSPDWFLTAFVVPFLSIGIWAAYYFIQQMLLHTGIGLTSLEISDHPLKPRHTYDLFLSQAGRMKLSTLELFLVCDEQATYHQGTDIRSEVCRVYSQLVFSDKEIRIEPGRVFERELELQVPTGIMHSFQANHNSVHWKLLVRGSTRRWPAIERSFPVVVYPDSSSQGSVDGTTD
jgi:hypothetical protein